MQYGVITSRGLINTLPGSSGGAGTTLNIQTGAGDGVGAGGGFTVALGAGGLTGAGGAIGLTAGAGGGTSGAGGAIGLTAGAAIDGVGGGITATAGAGGGANAGGAINLAAGAGGGTSGAGGALSLSAGSAAGTNSDGGNVSLTAGTQTGAGTAGTLTFNVAGVAYVWPVSDGAAGEQMTTNGSGVLSFAAGGAKVFRSNLTEGASDDFVINTGFGNAANEVVSITVRDNNNNIIQPDLVTFDATLDQVTINLALFRSPTLPSGFRVVAVG